MPPSPLTELTLPSVLYDRFINNPLDLCRDDNVRVTRAARRSPPPRRGGSSTPRLGGYLENPGADSFQSGIGVLSGWVCEGDEVEIEITTEGGEVARQVAAYGTEFLRGAEGECVVPDFPSVDETVTLAWQQNQQNFVIVSHDPDGAGP